MRLFKKIVCVFAALLYALNLVHYAKAERFEIIEYIVDINVLESGIYEVHEEIHTNFDVEAHGIYRNIPISGTVKRMVNGEKISTKYKLKISDVDVPGYDYIEYVEGENFFIKIGDKNKLISDTQVYEINYKVEPSDSSNKYFDEFYYNLIGLGWDTTINSAQMKIAFPKEIDPDKVYVSFGLEGTNNSGSLEYEIKNNTISIKTTESLSPHTGVTLMVQMDDGYFSYEPAKKIFGIFNIITSYYSMAGLCILFFVLWIIFGKNKKIIKIVEFYPPDDMTPAEMGYICDGVVDDKDVISLLVYWADKGYISLSKKSRTNFIITRHLDNPSFENDFENTVFYAIFKNPDKSENKLLKKIETNRIPYKLRSSLNKAKYEIARKYAKNENKGLYTRESKIIRKINLAACTLPYLFTYFSFHENNYIEIAPFFIIWVFMNIFIIYGFNSVQDVLLPNMRSKNSFKKLDSVFFPLFIGIPLYVMAKTIFTYSHDYSLGIANAVAVCILGLLSIVMKRPSDETNRMRGRIYGFKNFIKIVELQKLKTLYEEDDNYYSAILPFAYVTGMLPLWSRKFKYLDVASPNWYTDEEKFQAFRPMRFSNSLNRVLNNTSSGAGLAGGLGTGGGMRGTGGGMGGGGGGSW